MDDAPAAEREMRTEEPADGLVSIRGALGGLGLLWLTAMAGFGAIQAAAIGATASPAYLLVAVGAVALAAGAGYASLRSFGLT